MYWNGAAELPTMVGLGTLGGHNSEGSDINSSLVITDWAQTTGVGFGDDPTPSQFKRGFWYDTLEQPPTMREIPTLNDCATCEAEAYGINDNGIIVGWSQSQVAGPQRAFKYTIGQTVARDLGTLGGTHSWAWEINDNGKVVGHSTTADPGSPTHGFLHDGTMHDLGALADHNYALALDINNNDTVVGWSAPTSNPACFTSPFPCHATVKELNEPLCDLNNMLTGPGSTEWTVLHQARAIDSAGHIVGAGLHNIGGLNLLRGFLLTPPPPPITTPPPFEPMAPEGLQPDVDGLPRQAPPARPPAADDDHASMDSPPTALGSPVQIKDERGNELAPRDAEGQMDLFLGLQLA
jgi:probable HAF family extracellular repeat protein